MHHDDAAIRFERLRTLALGAGAAAMGACDPAPFADVAATMRGRISAGTFARLGFTYKDPDRATDPARSFPFAKSLLVVAWPYVPAAGQPKQDAPGTARVARFAETNHYDGLDAVLATITHALTEEGFRAEAVRDDDRLVDRAAAVRAGVGWWGKSTLVLVPGSGPWVLLGSVVTDAEVAFSAPMIRDCGTCTACIPACPTNAIIAPGVLDARRCLAAIAQAPGPIPAEFREAMADRLYGCDECLDACPPGHRLLEHAKEPRGRYAIADVLGADDERLLEEFGHFYIPQRDARFLRRNALVAAGNSGDGDLFAVVAGYVGHPDALLRLHAVWALRRIDPARAAAVFAHVRLVEEDDRVLAELAM